MCLSSTEHALDWLKYGAVADVDRDLDDLERDKACTLALLPSRPCPPTTHTLAALPPFLTFQQWLTWTATLMTWSGTRRGRRPRATRRSAARTACGAAPGGRGCTAGQGGTGAA